MRFASPEMLSWLWLLPLVIVGGLLHLRRRMRAASALADARLLAGLCPEAGLDRSVVRLVCLVLGLAGLLLGLARPQYGSHSRLVTRRGIDVVVALDTSRSMLAKDVTVGQKGNRLVRAKLEISGLIDRLQGDRIGLVSFAGAAFVQCPLTSDYAAAKLFLSAMQPGIIPVGGTNIGEALRVARQMFEGGRGHSRSKLVVLISDGEDHELAIEEELEILKRDGIVVHCVGIGTQIGELIPDGEGGYLRKDGKAVMTRLQEGTLRSIAESTGGLFVHSATGDLGFDVIYEMLSQLQKEDYESRVESVYEEQFQLFLIVGLLFLLAATLTPTRRDSAEERSPWIA